MELKDVKTILNRIKVNYPTFQNDDYTRSEWYNELKDYSLNDVMEKLEQHFRSEQYGNSIPKVYFLTKYLTKEKDKLKTNICYISCSICGKRISNLEMEKHYERCNSVDYLIRNSERYFDKKLNREKLMEADEHTFKNYYFNFCEKLLPLVNDNTVFRKSLENKLEIYSGRSPKYSMKEILD
jgi:hypothetical protein